MKKYIYFLLAMAAIAVTGCTDNEYNLGLEEEISTVKKQSYFIDPYIDEATITRSTAIEGLTGKDLYPRFEPGDRLDIEYIHHTERGDTIKHFYFTYKTYAYNNNNELVEVDKNTKGWIGRFHTENVPENFTVGKVRIEAKQTENDKPGHLRSLLMDCDSIKKEDISSEENAISKQLRFTVKANQAILKVKMKNFRYAIWGGGTFSIFKMTGGNHFTDTEKRIKEITLGDFPILSDDRPDTKNSVPFLYVPRYDENSTEPFEEHAKYYIGEKYPMTVYIAIPDTIQFSPGQILKFEVIGGWSNDSYIWYKTLKTQLKFEANKLYTIDLTNDKPVVAYETGNKSGVKTSTSYFGTDVYTAWGEKINHNSGAPQSKWSDTNTELAIVEQIYQYGYSNGSGYYGVVFDNPNDTQGLVKKLLLQDNDIADEIISSKSSGGGSDNTEIVLKDKFFEEYYISNNITCDWYVPRIVDSFNKDDLCLLELDTLPDNKVIWIVTMKYTGHKMALDLIKTLKYKDNNWVEDSELNSPTGNRSIYRMYYSSGIGGFVRQTYGYMNSSGIFKMATKDSFLDQKALPILCTYRSEGSRRTEPIYIQP